MFEVRKHRYEPRDVVAGDDRCTYLDRPTHLSAEGEVVHHARDVFMLVEMIHKVAERSSSWVAGDGEVPIKQRPYAKFPRPRHYSVRRQGLLADWKEVTNYFVVQLGRKKHLATGHVGTVRASCCI